MANITIGSSPHKELFCREFIDTHLPYKVEEMRWPALDGERLQRLRTLPFWQEALTTEQATAAKVQAQAQRESDPLVREAVALQGFEEARHSALLESLLSHYEISVPPTPAAPLPANIAWAFLRTEYGECFDSFFAFGLFAIAKESGFFAPELVNRFEPVMQEEARHILFFVNWLAYQRAQLPWWRQPDLAARCLAAMVVQVWSRIQTARGIGDGDFTLKGHESILPDLSPRDFLQLCLQENEQRLSRYDHRLLRPRLVPTMAKAVLRFLPK
jgi:hypothetical protein